MQDEIKQFVDLQTLKLALEARNPERYMAQISSTMPWAIDYKNRKHVYIYSGIALNLTSTDIGTIALPPSIWWLIDLPEGLRITATGQVTPVYIYVLATDEVLALNPPASFAIAGTPTFNIGNALPVGAVAINNNGTATAGTATATLTGAVGKFTYLTGFEITIIDTATAGSAELSLTGVNGGPLLYEIEAQGVVGAFNPFDVSYVPPLQSTAVNTNIVLTLPTLGVGTGKVSIVAHGYLL